MTIYGKIDCNIAAGSPNSIYWQNGVFKAAWDFFKYMETAGVCTEVGRYNGVYPPGYTLPGATGAGTDYPGDATPFGNNAWFTFKMNTTANRNYPYYIHMQIGYFNTYGTTTNHTGFVNGSNNSAYWGRIGVQVARGIGGTENPWNGSGALGSSTKGAEPFWVVPSGGSAVHVLPRSNGAAGAHVTSRKNAASLTGTDSSSTARVHFISNGDGILILHTITSTSYTYAYVGSLQGDSSLSKNRVVMIAAGTTGIALPIVTSQTFGDLAGTSDYQGGVIMPGTGVYTVQNDRLAKTISSTYQPNKQYSPARYDEYPIPIYCNESAVEGLLGFIPTDLVTETYGIASHDTNTALTKAFFNNGTTTQPALSVAWDGATVPGTTTSRDGVSFTI